MSAFAPVTIGHDSDVRELDDLSGQMNKLVERASSFVVKDDADRDAAVEYLKSLKAVYGVIEAVTERFRKPAWDYYKGVQETKKEILEPADQAVEIVKEKITAYRLECEEVAAALLQEELDKRESEETKAAEAAYRALIELGDAQGALKVAQEMRRDAPVVDTTEVAIQSGLITESEGVSYRDYWYAGLESPASMMDLVKAVAAGQAPLEFLTLNKTEVATWVKRQKSAFKYPGLKSWKETKIAVRK